MVSLLPRDVSPYKLVFHSFSFAGLMNYESSKKISVYIAYHWFIFHSFGIASILELCWGSRKLQDIIETLSGLAVYIIAFSKSIRCIRKRTKIRNFLDRLEIIRMKMLNDTQSRHFIIEADNFGRKFLTIIIIFVISTPFLSFTSTTIYDFLTNFKNKRLMLQVWLPWKMEQIWPYIAAKIIAALMSLSTILANLGFAFLEFTFTFQVSAYLKILRNNLENNGVKDKNTYEQHKVLIMLINDYNDIMSGQKYLETLIAPLMPCGFGLTLIRALRRKESNQFDALQKMGCCLLPPIIACSCGQEIITQMEKLHEASYMNNWYEESPRYRKDLLMLMIRTTKVSSINYKSFIRFDHVYLMRVLQAIYSYFMLIINFDVA